MLRKGRYGDETESDGARVVYFIFDCLVGFGFVCFTIRRMTSVGLIWLFLVFLAIPTIAIIDYFSFSKIGKCEECGRELEIKDFIIPTFFEISLFIMGVWFGLQAM